MKVTESKFICSAFQPDKFPSEPSPQIAFAGRSNVGKSSTINCLLQQKNLARISSHPGKTRSVNFIKINQKFYFVDLPGYGFAKVSKAERDKWKWLIESFFFNNPNLVGLIQIIDSRIGITEMDEELLIFAINLDLKPLIVATKYDKLNKKMQMAQNRLIAEQLTKFSLHEFIPFSAKTKLGKTDVWRWIDQKIFLQ